MARNMIQSTLFKFFFPSSSFQTKSRVFYLVVFQILMPDTNNKNPMPEFTDPVFAKTIPKRFQSLKRIVLGLFSRKIRHCSDMSSFWTNYWPTFKRIDSTWGNCTCIIIFGYLLGTFIFLLV